MADPKLLENLNIPGVGALVVSDANAVKGAGISAATSVQNNDTSVPTGKAVTTELNKKQNTLAAGTGLAFGTGADANKLGHSNSVTAKTSSSVKKFTYDANGHVTGSSELSTAESNTLASGITSTDVAQITTNKNNILTITPVTNTVLFGVSEANTYEQVLDLDVTLPAGKTIMITASAVYADGIVLSVGTSYTANVIGINDSNPDNNLNLNVNALFKNRDNTAKTVKTYVKRSATTQYAVSTWYTIV